MKSNRRSDEEKTGRASAPRFAVRAASALVFALALGGCASLNTREANVKAAATVTVPDGWSALGAMELPDPAFSNAAPDAVTLAAWWRQFGDDQLEQLIETALSTAPEARLAQARLRQARAMRDLARANLYPSIGASLGANRSRSGTGAGGNGQWQTLYSGGFDARWEPPIFNGLVDADDAAEADAAVAAANLESARASLAAEVALEYVNLRARQQRMDIVRANISAQAETLQISEWRERAGLVTQLDVEQARASLEQTRASLPSLELARVQAEHRLAVLTGRVPGSLADALREPRALPVPPPEIATGIPADTLRQRPDVRSAEFALRAEIARTAQSEAERYPRLTLTGSLDWRAVSLSALSGGANLARSLAANLAAPLFDAGRIKNRIAAQNAAQEHAFITWEKSLLTALEDVENAMSAYANGRERAETLRRAASAAEGARELARAQYEAGLIDFQRVLESERARLSAQDSLAEAEADVLTAVIRLYKALGGGWSADGAELTESSPS